MEKGFSAISDENKDKTHAQNMTLKKWEITRK